MRKKILQLVSVEPFFLWAGDVNAEETNLVFNMTDDAPPSSTTIPDDPDDVLDTWPEVCSHGLEDMDITQMEAPCAHEAEVSANSGHQLRSHFSH